MAESKSINRIGMDCSAPFGVYANGKKVAAYKSEEDACRHYDRLRGEALTPTLHQREKDRLRTAMQQPISIPRYRVLYLVNGRERQSAWIYNRDLAQRGMKMMQAKYGERNAIIYRD